MLLGVLLALTSAFCWGTSSVLIKVGLRGKSPVSANLIRLYFSSILYFLIFYFGGNYKEIAGLPLEYHILAFISAQFGFVIGDYFYFSALKLLGVSRTVPITSTYPLWTIIWAYLFLGRSVTLRIITGAVLIVIAIIMVGRVESQEHLSYKGILFALITPILWSIAIVIMDWLSNFISSLTLAGLRIIYAAVGVTFISGKFIGEIRNSNLVEVLIISTAGLLGLVVGQYSFVKSVSLLGSQIATPITAINPIISTGLAIIFLGESPNWKIIVSLILVVLGIWLISS